MIGPRLVVRVVPAIDSVTVTSLVRRMSSGSATPGTARYAGMGPSCASPFNGDDRDSNRSFLRGPIHHGFASASPVMVPYTRIALSAGTTTGSMVLGKL